MLHNIESQCVREPLGALAEAPTLESSNSPQPRASGSLFTHSAETAILQGCRASEPSEDHPEYLRCQR